MTRLRFQLKDVEKADTKGLEATDGVITVVQALSEYMVVIGQHVGKYTKKYASRRGWILQKRILVKSRRKKAGWKQHF